MKMAYVCFCGKETVYDCYDYDRNKKIRCPFKKGKFKEYAFLNVALHQATFALLMSKIKMNEIPVHFFTEVMHGRKFIKIELL